MKKLMIVAAAALALAVAACSPAQPPKHDYNKPETGSVPTDHRG